ncbi:MAG TPA: cytochrome c [Candidatus Binatia bacterium]|nr:cytochrome c [Candidatus Binatia bacterium]
MRLNKTFSTKAWFLSLSALFFLVFGCSKKSETSHSSGEQTPANWKFTLPLGDPANGKQLFVELECYKCHEVKGEPFPKVAETEKGIGPELSQMAGMHPAEFFAESIVNPDAVIDPEDKEKGFLGPDGKSRMPSYSDVLTVRQVADLAAYLNSLKKRRP